MRGASVVRRRSVPNLGDTSGSAGPTEPGQAEGGGSGLLADGMGSGVSDGQTVPAARREADPKRVSPSTGPQIALGQATAAQGIQAGTAPPQGAQSPSSAQGAQGTPTRQVAPATRLAQGRPRRGASSGSKFALSNWRVRWKLVAVIAVPTLIAAILGAFQIYNDASSAMANARIQHLAQLNGAVVQLTQALEDERDLSAGYAANRFSAGALSTQLHQAQAKTNSAASAVQSLAGGVTVNAGYQPAVVLDIDAVLNNVNDLTSIRHVVTTSQALPAKIIEVYTNNIIKAANAFSASIGRGANDATLQGDAITLGALLRVESDKSVQRAILYAALSTPQQVLQPGDLQSLNQAYEQEQADQSNFFASTDTTEQQNFNNTVSGLQVDLAASEEKLAITESAKTPPVALTTRNLGADAFTAGRWYDNMAATIGDTRKVVDDLTASITNRAGSLSSQATRGLVGTSVVTVLLFLLVLLVSAMVARSLIRPLRKLRSDALDVAGNRLPEMVRRLSQSEGADEGVEIEPIGVNSTDEIGEVARAFDQVHREAVRLAADEAMLRGNLNAMFINLSRRSQSLIERQLSLIDSLEQSEQDSGRLSSLFRLDHLATRMRRNSENLLVLAGHEVTRRWSQPVPLVDVLRAAISEIEQYERVVLNVQPGIVVVGQAVNDVVHLVAEIVENATTFSPEDTQVYVSGQPLSSGGVLLDITDNGVGISDQEMSHANWRLDNPPVVDVAVSRRMGLFVVGRLAARHGVRVRLRHAQVGGLTALIWLPDTVAAPEVAPPLGRLRRFEADDFGPAPSLSAPTGTLAPGAASQAAAAARIPRFSPVSPATPPTFTPPPAAPPAPAAPATPGAKEPAESPGTPAGNNWEAASKGWDLGGGRDEPTTQALPIRNGNGSTPAISSTAGSGTDAPDTQALPGGPSRLPSFTGLNAPGQQSPIGGKNVHGSDGPSASDTLGGLPGGQGQDLPADDTAVRGTDPGQVTIPPAAARDQRLPIFDSLESDWFRRSGKTLTTAARPQGPQASQAATGPQPAQASQAVPGSQGSAQAAPAAQTSAQQSWTSPADEGWRAAQVVASPAAGEMTSAGLPRRVPRANLVPGSVNSGGEEPETGAPARSADVARSRMSSFQRGVREGRAAAPQQVEEP
jgi:signal transduction histidine kinase